MTQTLGDTTVEAAAAQVRVDHPSLFQASTNTNKQQQQQQTKEEEEEEEEEEENKSF